MASGKRAQEEPSGSIAALVILLTILALLLFYILSVPEAQREYLNITAPEKILFQAKPGWVGEAGFEKIKTYTHSLPTILLDGSAQESRKLLTAQLTIKKGLWTEQNGNLQFKLDNLENIESANLEFYVIEATGGELALYLNGGQIFSAASQPNQKIVIPLPKEALQKNNSLQFTVSSPGARFWTTNLYVLSDVYLTVSAFDPQKAKAVQTISIPESEFLGPYQANLRFYPKKLGKSANIKIKLNGQEIYYGRPNSQPIYIPSNLLKVGLNKFEFTVEHGGVYSLAFSAVTITRSSVQPEIKKYIFSIDDALAKQIESGLYTCKVRLVRDKKISEGNSAALILNNQIITVSFTNSKAEYEICNYLKAGINNIGLSAEEPIYISQLQVAVK